MLGFLRTILAIVVVIYHLFYTRTALGIYSVFGFYIISGYLMTLIMHESYGYTGQGRLSFLVNRFLRLYPQYWGAATISVVLIYFLGSDVVNSYHGSMFLPGNAIQFIKNLFMTFLAWSPADVNPRLVPPTWALTVEIFFYILICAGISRTSMRVKLWFSLSMAYMIISFVIGASWEDRYYPFAAASLPFAIGSGIYFLSKVEKVHAAYLRYKVSPKFIFILILANCLLFAQIDVGTLIAEIGVYINLVLCALLVYGIVKGGKIINISDKLDKKIGDFSYPIYLLHWQTGLLVSYVLYGEAFHEYSFQGFVILVVSFIGIFTLSKIFISVIDKPVQLIRSKIKGKISIS